MLPPPPNLPHKHKDHGAAHGVTVDLRDEEDRDASVRPAEGPANPWGRCRFAAGCAPAGRLVRRRGTMNPTLLVIAPRCSSNLHRHGVSQVHYRIGQGVKPARPQSQPGRRCAVTARGVQNAGSGGASQSAQRPRLDGRHPGPCTSAAPRRVTKPAAYRVTWLSNRFHLAAAEEAVYLQRRTAPRLAKRPAGARTRRR